MCGDGKASAPEECDDGTTENLGDYGGCAADCRYAAYCGDGVVQEPEEQCDDGVNAATYGDHFGCDPGCRRPHYCGDGLLDIDDGEMCDYGPINSTACWNCRLRVE
jgi:cysteine-rich repeat protein